VDVISSSAKGATRPAPSPARRSPRGRQRRRDSWASTAFVAPSMVLFGVFVVVPMLASVGLSFYSWDLLSTPRWAGLTNFRRLLTDTEAWSSLAVTAEFLLMGVVPTVVLGFMLAVFVNTRMRGITAVRVLYLAPLVASTAVAGVLWAYMYDPRYGLIDHILGWVDINGPAWLSDTGTAAPALAVMLIWLALPLVIILYLAGLQRIPKDIYAAAALDGAGPWRQLWSVTWPNVVPTTVLVTILQIINFMNASFEVTLIMTGGGPLGSTQTLALYAYRIAFEQVDMGYAAALILLQLIVIGVTVGGVQAGVALRRRYR
jgi:multiple sugar transport system permease protein